MEKKQLKVCIMTIALAGGGAERSSGMLSKILHDNGYEVHVVTLTNKIVYDYAGKLFNLGIDKDADDSLLGKIRRFYKLRLFIKRNKFDYVIDNRTHQLSFREFFYLNYIYRCQNLIYVIRNYEFSLYFPPSRRISKSMVKKSKLIVCVAKSIENKLKSKYNTNNIVSIYNPIDPISKNMEHENDGEECVLFLGRLENKSKNIDLLIDAFAMSGIGDKIKLKIYGEGPDHDYILKKIDQMDLVGRVLVCPFDVNIHKIFANAKFLVLSSRYEGFPRVLIESLSTGTPIVSVDCKSGPSEIVKNEHNGLLVENFNVQALAQAIKRMFEDKELYRKCVSNSKNSVMHLYPEQIAKQWDALLRKTIDEDE